MVWSVIRKEEIKLVSGWPNKARRALCSFSFGGGGGSSILESLFGSVCVCVSVHVLMCVSVCAYVCVCVCASSSLL